MLESYTIVLCIWRMQQHWNNYILSISGGTAVLMHCLMLTQYIRWYCSILLHCLMLTPYIRWYCSILMHCLMLTQYIRWYCSILMHCLMLTQYIRWYCSTHALSDAYSVYQVVLNTFQWRVLGHTRSPRGAGSTSPTVNQQYSILKQLPIYTLEIDTITYNNIRWWLDYQGLPHFNVWSPGDMYIDVYYIVTLCVCVYDIWYIIMLEESKVEVTLTSDPDVVGGTPACVSLLNWLKSNTTLLYVCVCGVCVCGGGRGMCH